jgi:hypothetical protein
MVWAGHVTCVQNFLRKSEGSRSLREDLYVYGRIILKWVLNKEGGSVRTGLTWLRLGRNVGFLWDVNEHSDSVNNGEF